MNCSWNRALSVMFTEPIRTPILVGLNSTTILQLFVGARLRSAAQVVPLARVKSPSMLTELRISGEVPVLVRVTVWGLLVVPNF